MSDRERQLTVIWDDVVDFRELLIALVVGSVLGLTSYMIAEMLFKQTMSGLQPGLLKGYAMMAGLAGSVVAGVTAAKVFRPKRVFEELAEISDITDALASLDLDPEEEAEALAKLSPRVRREMEQLQIYDAFVAFSQTRRAPDGR